MRAVSPMSDRQERKPLLQRPSSIPINLAHDHALAPARPVARNAAVPSLGDSAKQPRRRIKCLDGLRGVAIVIMSFVNARGETSWLNTEHAQWDSRDAPLLRFADYAEPFFVFCIGVSCAIAFTGSSSRMRSKFQSMKHILRRTATLVVMGWWIKNWVSDVLCSGGRVDVNGMRLGSVLGRLGLSYGVVASMLVLIPVYEVAAVVTPRVVWDLRSPRGLSLQSSTAPETTHTGVFEVREFALHWLVVAALMAVYLGLVFGLAVPGCPRGYLGPGGSADGGLYANCTGGAMRYIDTLILGDNHVHCTAPCTVKYGCRCFDNQALFGVLPTILHVMLGFTAGRVLLLNRGRPEVALKRLVCWGVGWLVLGVGLDFVGFIPISKNMWSLSYVFYMSGIAALVLAFFFVTVDHPAYARWEGGVVRAAGMNAILLYVFQDVFDCLLDTICFSPANPLPEPTPPCPDDSTLLGGVILGRLFKKTMGMSNDSAKTVWAAIIVMLVLLLGHEMHRRKVYFKI